MHLLKNNTYSKAKIREFQDEILIDQIKNLEYT